MGRSSQLASSTVYQFFYGGNMDVVPLTTLAFVSTITPGPNNFMLLASGMNHGARRSWRHVWGVALGFAFLIFVVTLGLGTIFDRYAALEIVLKISGGLYLTYLAWKIFTTEKIGTTEAKTAPLTFLQAAAFQWVNPKAWVMATTAASTLIADQSPLTGALFLAAGFVIVGIPCISSWMLTGAYALRWIDNARIVKRINQALGLLLVATVVVLVA